MVYVSGVLFRAFCEKTDNSYDLRIGLTFISIRQVLRWDRKAEIKSEEVGLGHKFIQEIKKETGLGPKSIYMQLYASIYHGATSYLTF